MGHSNVVNRPNFANLAVSIYRRTDATTGGGRGGGRGDVRGHVARHHQPV